MTGKFTPEDDRQRPLPVGLLCRGAKKRLHQRRGTPVQRVAFMLENTDNALRHEAKTQSASAGQEAFEAFLSIVSDFHALGLSASGDLMLTAQTLWAGLHGLVALLIARPAFSWVERDLLIAAHVRMLRRGALR